MRNVCALACLLLVDQVASKLVREEITLTWELGAPNGQVRDMIKMNGEFPGPAYVWDEYDDIEVSQMATFFHITSSNT